MSGLTLEQLERLCREWQERLRLQDWDVLVRIVREAEMDSACAGAEVDWVLTKKAARVRMLSPLDYGEKPWVPQDQEVDLVHELIHLHFAGLKIKDDSPEDKALEAGIDFLARALVALKRGEGLTPAAGPLLAEAGS